MSLQDKLDVSPSFMARIQNSLPKSSHTLPDHEKGECLILLVVLCPIVPFYHTTRAIISFTNYGLVRLIELPKMRETALLPNKQVKPQVFTRVLIS